MSKNSKEYDEIASLLDSIENDDTLERKMDAFKAKKSQKNRLKRVNKEKIKPAIKPSTLPSEQTTIAMPKVDSKISETRVGDVLNGETRTIKPVDEKMVKEEIEHTNVVPVHQIKEHSKAPSSHTTVFNPNAIKQSEKNANKTIVLDENQVQSILEQSAKNPVLERKVVSKPDSKKPNLSKDQQKKLLMVIGALLVVILGFGLFRVISSNVVQNDQTEDVNDSNYERLSSWIDGYDSLSDSDKENITTYENIYNKLSRSQKQKINNKMKEKTGKTFEELLKNAKKTKSNKSKNSNVKNAEKKASLRSQISKLNSQLASAQSELDSATNEVNDYQSQIDSINSQISSEENTLNALKTKVTQAQSALNNAGDGEDTQELEQALEQAQSNYNSGVSSYNSKVSDLNSQLNSLNTQLTNAQSTQSSAQNKVNDLNRQIADLQSQLNALD